MQPREQPEPVDRLQQHRVTLRRQRALPAAGPDLLHPPVSRVKQGLHCRPQTAQRS